MSITPKKILVADCWTIKALSVVRSLGLAGYEVHSLSHTRIGSAQYSSFVKKRFIFPHPGHEAKLYRSVLLNLVRQEKYDCLLLLEEHSIKACYPILEELKKATHLLLPSEEMFDTANNKWEVLKLAQKLNIPIPMSFSPTSETEAVECITKIPFPIVLKPRSSSGSRGLYKVNSKEEFTEAYQKINSKYGPAVIQECIEMSGQGLGVGAIVVNGVVKASYSYKRLREFPVGGGPSTLRETTSDAQLIGHAHKLLEALSWNGVAMVEFKMDPKDGIPKLMEVNPRFWGSLELAQVAGLNFPEMLCRAAMNETIQQPQYSVGIRCRWLFPGDLAHFISNPRRFSMKPSFFTFFDANTYYDDFKSFDIRGSIANIVCTFLSIFDIETWKIGVFRK